MQGNCCAPPTALVVVVVVVAAVARQAYLQPAGVAAVACNLKSAICNTISAQQRKNEVIGNDCQTEAARAVAGHSACQLVAATHCTYTYIFIYVSKHPNKIFGILGLFFTAALLCLDLLRFLAASFPSCPPMWHAARVDNQASAYKTQCLQLSWHAKRLASHVELCD